MASLQFLYLHHNELELFKTDFSKCAHFEVLDLSHNKLQDWSISLAPQSKVELNMAYCGIKRIDSPGSKYELNVEGNQLENINLGGTLKRLRANNNRITKLVIEPPIYIEVMELANNSLLDISIVGTIDQLLVLDLSDNDLSSIVEKDSFSNLTSLTYLSLKNTGVQLTASLLERNSHLISLDMSSNRLRKFNFISLRYLTNLQILHLASNELTELKGYEDIKEVLPKLSTIGLSNNSFTCAYLEKLLVSLEGSQVQVSGPVSLMESSLPNIKGIKCIPGISTTNHSDHTAHHSQCKVAKDLNKNGNPAGVWGFLIIVQVFIVGVVALFIRNTNRRGSIQSGHLHQLDDQSIVLKS